MAKNTEETADKAKWQGGGKFVPVNPKFIKFAKKPTQPAKKGK